MIRAISMRIRQNGTERRRRRTFELAQARKIMRELKTESEEALLGYCQDDQQNAHNRLRACLAAAYLLGRSAVPLLLRLAADEDIGTVDAALHGLRVLGTRHATRLLIGKLRRSETDTRRQAALDALRFLGDPRSERSVSQVLLTDKCALTRELAAEVLGYINRGRRSVRALMQALSDPSPSVRWWALVTLSGIPAVYPSDLAVIQEYLSDQSLVSGAESPEKATVSWAARHALSVQASMREGKRTPSKYLRELEPAALKEAPTPRTAD
jgi:HEAT repeat protein